MTDEDHESVVTFGGYDSKSYAKNMSNLVWIPVQDTYFWSTLMNGYRIGAEPKFENGRPSEYSIAATYAIFDTGTSLTYLPSSKIFLINTL
jgi:Eukaryotic aspartyl protease